MARARRDAKRLPSAGAAPVKTKDKARFFRRAAMNVGKNAERSVIAAHQRRLRFLKDKTWSPHQRSIPEDPEIAMIRLHSITSSLSIHPSMDRANLQNRKRG